MRHSLFDSGLCANRATIANSQPYTTKSKTSITDKRTHTLTYIERTTWPEILNTFEGDLIELNSIHNAFPDTQLFITQTASRGNTAAARLEGMYANQRNEQRAGTVRAWSDEVGAH